MIQRTHVLCMALVIAASPVLGAYAAETESVTYYVPIHFSVDAGLHQVVLSCTGDVHINRLAIYVPEGIIVEQNTITIAGEIMEHPTLLLDNHSVALLLPDRSIPKGSHMAIPILALGESDSIIRMEYISAQGVSCNAHPPLSGPQSIGLVATKQIGTTLMHAAEVYNQHLDITGEDWYLEIKRYDTTFALNQIKLMHDRGTDVVLVHASDGKVAEIQNYVDTLRDGFVVMFLYPDALTLASSSAGFDDLVAEYSDTIIVRSQGSFADSLVQTMVDQGTENALVLYEGDSRQADTASISHSLFQNDIYAKTLDYSNSHKTAAETASVWSTIWPNSDFAVVLLPAESPQRMLEEFYVSQMPHSGSIYTDHTYSLNGTAAIFATQTGLVSVIPGWQGLHNINLYDEPLEAAAYGSIEILANAIQSTRSTDADTILSAIPGAVDHLMLEFEGDMQNMHEYTVFVYDRGVWIDLDE